MKRDVKTEDIAKPLNLARLYPVMDPIISETIVLTPAMIREFLM
jgi:hypothetical protein